MIIAGSVIQEVASCREFIYITLANVGQDPCIGFLIIAELVLVSASKNDGGEEWTRNQPLESWDPILFWQIWGRPRGQRELIESCSHPTTF